MEDEDKKLLSVSVPANIEVSVDESPDSTVNRKLQRFAELIDSGVTPGRAADAIGTTLKGLRNSDEMKAAVESLINTASLSSKAREAMVKAGVNKIFLRNVDSEGVKEQKIALEAAKLIQASEGMATGEAPTVTIDLSTIGPLIKDISLPGITIDIPKETDEKENKD